MDSIKERNVIFWTENIPYAKGVNCSNLFNSEFWEEADKERYKNEINFERLFDEILQPSLVSLEIGCGSGNDLRTFARYGLRVTGLDYSPENAYLSGMGLRACRFSGKVVSGDAECLPFPDESFDLVYSWGVIHHTPDTQRCIDEVYRVLRPGGKAVVMLYHKGYQYWYILATYIFLLKFIRYDLESYISYKYDKTPLSKMFSRGELHNLFKEFNNVDIHVIAYPNTRYHPVLRYVWKIFQIFSSLAEKFGSFGIVIAYKPGRSDYIIKPPDPCCPICHTELNYFINEVKCKNSSCGVSFPVYKNETPLLHPNAQQVYKNFLDKSSNVHTE